jgi:hypothetical protein
VDPRCVGSIKPGVINALDANPGATTAATPDSSTPGPSPSDQPTCPRGLAPGGWHLGRSTRHRHVHLDEDTAAWITDENDDARRQSGGR